MPRLPEPPELSVLLPPNQTTSPVVGDTPQHQRRVLFGATKSKRAEWQTTRQNFGGNPLDRCGTAGNSSSPFAERLIGDSPCMFHLHRLIERVAPTNSSVLITGATGTGKELVARAIHQQSERRNGPFIDVNCSAIPETLLEAELFGYQRGSFTGAHESRRGLFEAASGGTLFLDEVDAFNLTAQAKLLRALQERQVRRIGGRENILIDMRVISATSRDLRDAVAAGDFRADLLYRLRVVPLYIPELCRRGASDLNRLIEFFLLSFAEQHNRSPRAFSAEAIHALLAYDWPGNVRELENVVEYACTISEGREIGLEDLPSEVLADAVINHDMLKECSQRSLPLEEVERRYIRLILESCNGNQARAAQILGIDRRTLGRKLKNIKAEARLQS